MENSKYYELTESDLEIGLECEYITSNNRWVKFKIDSFSTMANIVYNKDKTYSLSENWRIKYLDRSDIEELGWEHDQTTKDGAVFYIGTLMSKYQWSLTAYNALQRLGGDYTLIGITDINNNSDNEFYGTVKNKSELKKLMKMLGINK